METQEQQEIQGSRDNLVFLALLDQLEYLELLELLVRQVIQDRPELLADKVSRVHLDSLAHPVQVDHRAALELRDKKVLQEIQEYKDNQVRWILLCWYIHR